MSPTLTVRPGRIRLRFAAQRVAGEVVRRDEAIDHGRRRQQPHAGRRRHRADRVFAIERLADDAAGKGRQRGIRPARAHADRRQSQRAAVDEAAPRVVVDEQLAHRLLRAVRRLRRQRGGLGHDLRQRAAVHRAAAGEDDARPVAAGAADSSSSRVLSKLTRIPRSKSASAWPLTTAAR